MSLMPTLESRIKAKVTAGLYNNAAKHLPRKVTIDFVTNHAMLLLSPIHIPLMLIGTATLKRDFYAC